MDIAFEKKLQRTIKRARMYVFLTIVVLAGAVYYSYTQYLDFREMQTAIREGQELLATSQIQAADLKSEYNFAKEEYIEKQSSRLEEIESVFPKNEALHALTTALEKYFVDNNTGNNRIFLNSIDYGKPTAPKTADKQETDYMVLPVTLSLESSQDNFMKFLKYLENSGAFESKSRLMSLESITFSVPEEKEGEKATGVDTLNFSMKINAYFQKGA